MAMLNPLRLLLLLATCLSASPIRAADLETDVASRAVALNREWPVGTRYVYRSHTTQRIAFPPESNQDEQESAISQDFTLTVLAEEEDGDRELELRWEAVSVRVSIGGKEFMSYDSANPEAAGNDAKPMDVLLQEKVKLIISKDGSTVTVPDGDKLVAKIGKDGAITAELARTFLEEHHLRSRVDAALLPLKAVAPGETWSAWANVAVPGLGAVKPKVTVTFVEVADHDARQCAKLKVSGMIDADDALPRQEGPITILVEGGTSEATVWLTVQGGALAESTSEQRLNLLLESPEPDPLVLSAGKLELIQKTTVTLLREEQIAR
jgi:hypothetical protein